MCRTFKGVWEVLWNMEQAEVEVEEPEALSLLGLVRTLAAPATLPHLLGFLGLGSVFFLAVDRNAAAVASLYLGMALSYVLAAALVERPVVRASLVPSNGGLLRRTLAPLVLPVLLGGMLALGVSGLSSALLGERGPELLPLGLASLFIAWSVGQARSFRTAIVRWPTPDDVPRTRAGPGRTEHLRRLLGVAVLLHAVLVVQSAIAGTSILDPNVSLMDVLRTNAMLVVVLWGVLLGGEVLGRASRAACDHDASLSAMHRRWHILAVAFAGWHLATAARHVGGQGSQVVGMVEEVLLMTLTVLMAIWSMTSRSRGSELGLVRSSNALFWGLGFGYAYAGSVAMLSTVMRDVSGVLSFGHVVVAGSLLLLLRSTGQRLGAAHAHAMGVARQGEEVAARLAVRTEEHGPKGANTEPEAAEGVVLSAGTTGVVRPAPEPSITPVVDDDPIEVLD